MRGSALVEFALAWPVALLIVLGAVEISLWASESFAARDAALAAARAEAVAGGSPAAASRIAISDLQAGVFGAPVIASCNRALGGEGIEVCVRDLGPEVDVAIDGSVPSLVPLAAGHALPISAHAVVRKEVYET